MGKWGLFLFLFIILASNVDAAGLDCLVVDDRVNSSGPGGTYLVPVNWMCLSNTTNAHIKQGAGGPGISLFKRCTDPGYPYKVHCNTHGASAFELFIIANQINVENTRTDFGSFLSGHFQDDNLGSANSYVQYDIQQSGAAQGLFGGTNINTCYLNVGACSGDDSCVISVSGDTNAHVGNCTAYPTKLCCDLRTLNAACADSDHDSYSPDGGSCGLVDCNDNRDDVYPGATEDCDGIDNDCDTQIDEGCDTTSYCGDGIIQEVNSYGIEEQCEEPGSDIGDSDFDSGSCASSQGLEVLTGCTSTGVPCQCEYSIPDSGEYSVRQAGECINIDDNGIGEAYDRIIKYDGSGNQIGAYDLTDPRTCVTTSIDEPFMGTFSIFLLVSILITYYLIAKNKRKNEI